MTAWCLTKPCYLELGGGVEGASGLQVRFSEWTHGGNDAAPVHQEIKKR
jgi:hypothetical protein